MLPDGDTQSNGHATARSNGSNLLASQLAAMSGATNGTHKSALSTNGSSLGDKANPPPAVQQPLSYFGHSSEEVTRLLIQALSDMGHQTAAEMVSRDSGFDLESPTVVAFRSAVLDGLWSEAEKLLAGAAITEGEGNGLVLAAGSDRNVMKFWLRQQKFLELVEQRETSRALVVLRGELTPLHQDTSTLHFLARLLMCRDAEDLKAKANWDGARGHSRKDLLSRLSRCISPSVMLPEHRLAVLLEQLKQTQIDGCLYHTVASSPSLYSDHYCDRRNFPTEKALELNELGGEVWQVQFSNDGSKIAACGSRECVMIWDIKTFTVQTILAGHELGVGNLAWSPDDSLIVTCSQDKHARLWNAATGSLMKKTRKFEEPVIGCVWAGDGASFTLGTLDKMHSLCSFNVHDEGCVEWEKKHRVQDLCGSPDGRWLVAVDDSSNLHVYNGLTRELDYHLDMGTRPTSVSISQDSRHLLVNRKDGEVQLIDLVTRNSVQKFPGHKGGAYLIRSSFGGANESFVASGNEDGSILIWHKNTGAAVERLHGHMPRCNAVCFNPADPCMLASCGDDGQVKMYVLCAREMAKWH
ncbi:WD domain-containing protein [Ophiocordyceps sinensis CO18]|uniref:WD domain-containing protein n=1 Tax=Ophiocordyceps sinensis (strain Co18 / CGMCC 3.14243) TaxID=911162 RepID=T5A285_OPHSC|nr:WD domain-containing protein [Ophiocordyceps sinensis CO18]